MAKSLNDLGSLLKHMYDTAERKKQVAMIHLFSIAFHNEIKEFGIKEVVEASGIPSTYRAEVNKGVTLADFVDIKQTKKALLRVP